MKSKPYLHVFSLLYFYTMINPNDVRAGNLLLYKSNNKIARIACEFHHLEQMYKGDTQNFYPIVIKADLLEKSGFVENKKYPLYPEAHEFKCILAIQGSGETELVVYIKSNGESFGRLVVNGVAASNNFYHAHQMQNLYYALTGKEMEIRF